MILTGQQIVSEVARDGDFDIDIKHAGQHRGGEIATALSETATRQAQTGHANQS